MNNLLLACSYPPPRGENSGMYCCKANNKSQFINIFTVNLPRALFAYIVQETLFQGSSNSLYTFLKLC